LSHWQRRLRYAVALFVVVFAALVAVSFRKGQSRPPAPPVPKGDKDAVFYTSGGLKYTGTKQGKTTYSIQAGTQATYPDNRSKFGGGVTVVLPEKSGRQITIQSRTRRLPIRRDTRSARRSSTAA